MGFVSDMLQRLLLAFFVIAFATAASAQMYRWVDKQGKVHYTDIPPPPNEVKQVEEKKLTGNVVKGEQTPYATAQATKDFPVTLYTGDCGDVCKSAKALLTARGVPFTERQPSKNPADAEAFKKISSDNSIPVLVVGKTVLKGYLEAQWTSTLDSAGYLKGAASSPAPGQGSSKPY